MPTELTCAKCEAPFIPTGKGQKYCSHHCAWQGRKESYAQEKTCPECGKQYSGLYNKTTCSLECYQIWRKKNPVVKKQKKKASVAECPVCRKIFPQRVYNQVYCSRHCGQRAWYEAKKHRELEMKKK